MTCKSHERYRYLLAIGKVNVWPTTHARSPLYTYNLPPSMQAVLLAGRIIFGVYEGKVRYPPFGCNGQI